MINLFARFAPSIFLLKMVADHAAGSCSLAAARA